jgi:hypothetical protein
MATSALNGMQGAGLTTLTPNTADTLPDSAHLWQNMPLEVRQVLLRDIFYQIYTKSETVEVLSNLGVTTNQKAWGGARALSNLGAARNIDSKAKRAYAV